MKNLIKLVFCLFVIHCILDTIYTNRQLKKANQQIISLKADSSFYLKCIELKDKEIEQLNKKKNSIISKCSYYTYPFHGRKTASGERYNMYDYTAAHKTLPFGTKVKITNLKNNKSVIVRITDRGPFIKGREIDLSLVAFQAIGNTKSGVLNCKIEKV